MPYFMGLDNLPFPVTQDALDELVLSFRVALRFHDPLTETQSEQMLTRLEEWFEETDGDTLSYMEDDLTWEEEGVAELLLNTNGLVPEFGVDLRKLLLAVHEVSTLEGVDLSY